MESDASPQNTSEGGLEGGAEGDRSPSTVAHDEGEASAAAVAAAARQEAEALRLSLEREAALREQERERERERLRRMDEGAAAEAVLLRALEDAESSAIVKLKGNNDGEGASDRSGGEPSNDSCGGATVGQEARSAAEEGSKEGELMNKSSEGGGGQGGGQVVLGREEGSAGQGDARELVLSKVDSSSSSSSSSSSGSSSSSSGSDGGGGGGGGGGTNTASATLPPRPTATPAQATSTTSEAGRGAGSGEAFVESGSVVLSERAAEKQEAEPVSENGGSPNALDEDRPLTAAETLALSSLAQQFGLVDTEGGESNGQHPSVSSGGAVSSLDIPLSSESEDDLDPDNALASEEYAAKLTEAMSTNFLTLEKTSLIHICPGTDGDRHPIVVFVASELPNKADVPHDTVLLYLIKTLDHIVSHRYNLVYIHSNFKNKPNMAWLSNAYTLLSRKYKKRLLRLLVVHPTFWLKAVFNMATPLVSKKFWKKMVYINDLQELFQTFPEATLSLPSCVYRYEYRDAVERRVFGNSLEGLMSDDATRGRGVPRVFDSLVTHLLSDPTYLQSEGIFRVSASLKEINQFIWDVSHGVPIQYNRDDPYLYADVLKAFIRSLSEPLFPFHNFDRLVAVVALNEDARADALRVIVESLPPVNLATLNRLMEVLWRVVEYAPVNMMPVKNVAIVIGPNIARSLNGESATMAASSGVGSEIMTLLLTDPSITNGAGQSL